MEAAAQGSGGSGGGGDDRETLAVMVWNINCLGPTVKNMELRYKSFRGYLDHWGVDIACFQEVKLPAAKITREFACVPGFQSFWATSTGKAGYSGVTTWCRCPDAAPRDAAADCLGGDERPELDTEGRLVLTDHGSFVLLNAYVPNAGDRPERARLEYKLAFLAALRAKMDELAAEGRQVIAVGDFNVAAEPRDVHAAIKYDTLYDEREVAALRGMAAAYPDVWRSLHPEAEGAYTVWEERTSARAFNVGLRIDYVFVSPSLLPFVESCEILSAADIPPKWSDHAALLLKLRVRRPGQPAGLLPCARPVQQAEGRRLGVKQEEGLEQGQPAQKQSEQEQGPSKPEREAAEGDQQEDKGQAAPSCTAVTADSTDAQAFAADAPPRLQLAPPPAAPCAMWQAMEARFVDRSQKSIRDLFGRRGSATESSGSAPAASTKAPAAAQPMSVQANAEPAGAAPKGTADAIARCGGVAGGGRKRAPEEGDEDERARLPPALRPGAASQGAEAAAAGEGPEGSQGQPCSAEREEAARLAGVQGGGDAGERQAGSLTAPAATACEGQSGEFQRATGAGAEPGQPAGGGEPPPEASCSSLPEGPGQPTPLESSQGASAGAGDAVEAGPGVGTAGAGGAGGKGAGGGGSAGSRAPAGRGAAGGKALGRKGQGRGAGRSSATAVDASKQRGIQSFFKGK